MKKHASSHGLAVLVCTITGGVLVHIGREYYPNLMKYLNGLSRFIVSALDLSYSADAISTLILAFFLSLIWGVAFYYIHSDSRKK